MLREGVKSNRWRVPAPGQGRGLAEGQAGHLRRELPERDRAASLPAEGAVLPEQPPLWVPQAAP